MSMPRVPIPLPPAESRCSSDACPRTSQCARRRASVEMGSPMQDYSQTANWDSQRCAGFVDMSSLRREQTEKPRQAAKPYPSED